jgi:hypothetical protein
LAGAAEIKVCSEQEERDTNSRLSAELAKMIQDQQAAEAERIRLLSEVERHKRELAATKAADQAVDALIARCTFFDRILHPRMPLVPTPDRLKRTCV